MRTWGAEAAVRTMARMQSTQKACRHARSMRGSTLVGSVLCQGCWGGVSVSRTRAAYGGALWNPPEGVLERGHAGRVINKLCGGAASKGPSSDEGRCMEWCGTG